ncbi:MAG: nucleoside deaminase [Coprobacillus sp.]|nr:nucleoside deaminase [Coprobacillus sp.]
MPTDDELHFMNLALEEAKKALLEDEVPVGAVLVKDGKTLVLSHNCKENEKNPTAHAEIRCIEAASKQLGRWRLNDCDLYVTLEPCLMCAGAIVEARIGHIYIGALDPQKGAIVSTINLLNIPNLNHRPEVTYGIMKEECEEILTTYFRGKR